MTDDVVPAPPAQSWLSRGVLIYGPRKGGTTLLQALLDGADGLFVYPAELKLKRMLRRMQMTEAEYQSLVVLPENGEGAGNNAPASAWTAADYAAHNRTSTVGTELFDRALYDSRWETAGPAKPLAELLRKDVLAAYDSCRRRPGAPAGWAAKEVGGRTGRIVALWRRLFPEGRIVFITRSPLMTARAILGDRRRKNERMSAFGVFKQVFDSVLVNAAIARHAGASGELIVSYEELVASPETVMRRICGFLGLAFDPRMTEPTSFGHSVVVSTASRPSRSVFASADAWHSGLSLRERLLVAFSYPLAVLWSGIAARWR